ncbi:MAG TPA: ABC transporter permease [Stellaceae bacterium]|nr:ABC transporter permease [Stellaceae bacterium]
MRPGHALQALIAVASRELVRFVNQTGRLLSALVRPALWLLVFAAGFQNVLGISITPPYETYITYQVYVIPGLLGMVLLFNGMQSSLSMVYDREMGMMRLLLTAPLPRWYLLLCKLLSGVVLSVLQAYAFLVVAVLVGVDLPLSGFLYVLPALVAAGIMLGALGLALSVRIRQLENFAGTMNFVIFPMFFLSTALYPLWRLRESGAEWLDFIARCNPFTYAVELVRFALYGRIEWVAAAAVAGAALVFFLIAAWGYDPQRAFQRRPAAAPAG